MTKGIVALCIIVYLALCIPCTVEYMEKKWYDRKVTTKQYSRYWLAMWLLWPFTPLYWLGRFARFVLGSGKNVASVFIQHAKDAELIKHTERSPGQLSLPDSAGGELSHTKRDDA